MTAMRERVIDNNDDDDNAKENDVDSYKIMFSRNNILMDIMIVSLLFRSWLTPIKKTYGQKTILS